MTTIKITPKLSEDLLTKYNHPVPRYTSYPTAPHFHAGITQENYKSWLTQIPPAEPISLYVHLPFCKALCWYCGCNMKVVNKPEAMRPYMNALIAEIKMVAGQIKNKLPVSALHFGGGTPTHTPNEMLVEIMQTLQDNFNILPTAEIAMEIDPRTLDSTKAKLLKTLGVNRASLGVQDFHKNTQKAINRVQPFELVQNTVNNLKNNGITDINFDLIYGLPYQSTHSIQQTVELAVSLNPSRFALFGYAHVPWLKTHQKLLEEHNLPNAETRHQLALTATKHLKKHGYPPIGLDHFAKPEDNLFKALKNKTLHRNFQGYTTDSATTMLGFGSSSIGETPSGYTQNDVDVVKYRQTIENGNLPIIKGIVITQEDKLRRQIIMELMCYSTVNTTAICQQFGLPVSTIKTSLNALKELEKDKLLTLKNGTIKLTKQGQVLMRIPASCFDSYFTQSQSRHAKAV